MRLLFVFVFLSSVAFGQISVSQLIRLAKMDRENFEINANNKGFAFDRINTNDDENTLFMNKEVRGSHHSLKHSTKFFGSKYRSNYSIYNYSISNNTK